MIFQSYNLNWDILRVIQGSVAYGTNNDNSDIDIKGICIQPVSNYLNPIESFEQHVQNDPDITIYDIKKFISLALQCNPNFIEILFTNQTHITYINEIGIKLQSLKNEFLSKKAYQSFINYASGQTKRIKNHKYNIDNPPVKPDRKVYGLPLDRKLVTEEARVKICQQLKINNYSMPSKTDLDIVKMKLGEEQAINWYKEQQFFADSQKYQKYLNWMNNRNDKRYETEVKYGYDTKHAYHLIRLLRMGAEILEKGEVNVYRKDREDLISIRNGEWDYDKLLAESETISEKCKELEVSSILPEEPNTKFIIDNMIELIFEFNTNKV
jgi:predicted nucleotidyltransferase